MVGGGGEASASLGKKIEVDNDSLKYKHVSLRQFSYQPVFSFSLLWPVTSSVVSPSYQAFSFA